MATRIEAREAKESARAGLELVEGFTGVGIVKADDGYGLRVNLETGAAIDDVPDEIDGVPVTVEVVGEIEAYE